MTMPSENELIKQGAARAVGEIEPDDKLLVLSYKEGQKGAYQAIYDRYSPRVSSVCRRMLASPQDAEEAGQETFLRVYQALGRFNGRYQLGPWITRIATNVCLDQLRSQRRRPADPTPFIEDLEPTCRSEIVDNAPEDIYLRRLESRRVRKILAALPPLHRAAIVLRDFEGLSYEEVAIALELSESQVKSLIHRARQNFKRSWASQALAALVPLRWLGRLRRTTVAEQRHSLSLGQSGEAASTLTQAGVTCSTALQQCGQMVGERAAAVVTAALARPAAVAATASQAASVRIAHPKPAHSTAKKVSRPAPRHAPDEAALPPVAPTPTPASTEAPPAEDPAAEPPAAEPPAEDPAGEPAPEASPTEPAAPVEPSTFAFDFGSNVAYNGSPCCAEPDHVTSEHVIVVGSTVESFDQSVEGAARAAGNYSYGLVFQQSSDHATDHSISFRLITPKGWYMYTGEGSLFGRDTTEWGGYVYHYTGTYQLMSRPGGSTETMPTSGRYSVNVTVSTRQSRIIGDAITLEDGS